jgi:diguanylate cyclase (GGDEF)-like protein
VAGELQRRVLAAHDHHLEVYFGRRDLAAALATYDPEAIGIGTGRSEWGGSAEAMRAIVRNDLHGFPDPVGYRVRDRVVLPVAADVVVCQCVLDLSLPVGAHRMKLRDLRHSVVMRFDDPARAPRIVHIHVSFPTSVHGDEEPYPLKEIEEITAVLDDLIANRTRDLLDAYRRLEHVAVHDRLTGLHNRIRLDEKLSQEIKRARRYGSRIALVLIDVDRFKEINDRYGHLAGDQVLMRLGALIRDSLRETDAGGRWGGEEFLLVLPETGAAEAVRLAERIRQAFARERFRFEDEDIGLSVSCGVAEHRQGDDAETLFARTDRALYRAKRQGRDRTQAADPDG